MLDEIFDVIVGELSKLVPDVVWGAVFLVVGALTAMIGVSTVLGVSTLNASPRFGGVLTLIGVSLVVGVLISWYR